MPHRYFTTEISDGTATLRGADAHHLARVMRGKLGDTVILCDGNAVEYTAVQRKQRRYHVGKHRYETAYHQSGICLP